MLLIGSDAQPLWAALSHHLLLRGKLLIRHLRVESVLSPDSRRQEAVKVFRSSACLQGWWFFCWQYWFVNSLELISTGVAWDLNQTGNKAKQKADRPTPLLLSFLHRALPNRCLAQHLKWSPMYTGAAARHIYMVHPCTIHVRHLSKYYYGISPLYSFLSPLGLSWKKLKWYPL